MCMDIEGGREGRRKKVRMEGDEDVDVQMVMGKAARLVQMRLGWLDWIGLDCIRNYNLGTCEKEGHEYTINSKLALVLKAYCSQFA